MRQFRGVGQSGIDVVDPKGGIARQGFIPGGAFGKTIEDHGNRNSGPRRTDFSATDLWAAAKELLPRRHIFSLRGCRPDVHSIDGHGFPVPPPTIGPKSSHVRPCAQCQPILTTAALSGGSSRECYHATETGGDRVEREQVLAKLRERIVRFAASHLSRDAAEDLAQEVLLLLHEKYAHLERVEDLLPLSLRIVRFKIMSQRRKSVRHGEYTQVSITDIQLPDLDANPAEYVERKQMLERLAKAMSSLGDRCRELMRLKLQGKAFPEIQKIMGVAAINTIYTWDHRCRKNLLEAMGGSWEPPKR
jgi:RNA polymerase sigma-70 factor (ECF subfamily)